MKLALVTCAALVAQPLAYNPRPQAPTKLSYADCVRIGSDIDIATENVQALESELASQTSASARQALERELSSARQKLAKAKVDQLSGCVGVTITDPARGSATELSGSLKETLGGGSPAPAVKSNEAAPPSSACAPRLKTLQNLRAELPKIQLRISTIDAQLNAKIAPPSAADRVTLQKQLAAEKNDEQYTLTQISVIKETLVSLGCDPDTGKDAPELKKFAEKPPGTGSIANPEEENQPLCDRLPADVRQIVDARSSTPEAQKASSDLLECHLEQSNMTARGEYYGIRLSVYKDATPDAADARLNKLRVQSGDYGVDTRGMLVGNQGWIYGDYNRNLAVFRRGRYLVRIHNPNMAREDMKQKVAELARRMDEIVSRW